MIVHPARWRRTRLTATCCSLVPPRPHVETDFASRHHCAFWAVG